MEDGPRFYGALKDCSDGSGKPTLVFNHQGKIDPIILTDFNQLFFKAPVYPEKVVPFEDLSNACLVYQVAKSIGVIPGMFSCGDKALKQELGYRLSNRFRDKDKEVSVLLKSWDIIASHPIAQPFAKMFIVSSSLLDRIACSMKPFGAFELFIQYYMMGLSKIIAHAHRDYLNDFVNAINLVDANVDGRWYFTNKYVTWPVLKKYVDNLNIELELNVELQVDLKVKSLSDYVNKQCAFLKRMWFSQNRDMITLAVNHFHTEFSDHLDDLCAVMYFFCTGRDFTDLDGIVFKKEPEKCRELFDDLTHPQLLLSNPKFRSSVDAKSYDELLLNRDRGPKPTAEDIKQAIIWTCYQYGHQEGIFCFHDPREQPVWRGIGQDSERDKAIFAKWGEFDQLELFQLYHLAKSAKFEPLKEALLSELKERCSMSLLNQGFSQMGLDSRFIVGRRNFGISSYRNDFRPMGFSGLIPSMSQLSLSQSILESEEVEERSSPNIVCEGDGLHPLDVICDEELPPLSVRRDERQEFSPIRQALWLPRYNQLERSIRGEMVSNRLNPREKNLGMIDDALDLMKPPPKSSGWFGFF